MLCYGHSYLGLFRGCSSASARTSLPVFLGAPARVTGLDMLASAALGVPITGALCKPLVADGRRTTAALEGEGHLHIPGPFNPTASLPQRVVKRILDLDFLEMAEITADVDPLQSANSPPAQPQITSISMWLERFSLMVATLVTRFPEKVPELFAYVPGSDSAG